MKISNGNVQKFSINWLYGTGEKGIQPVIQLTVFAG